MGAEGLRDMDRVRLRFWKWTGSCMFSQTHVEIPLLTPAWSPQSLGPGHPTGRGMPDAQIHGASKSESVLRQEWKQVARRAPFPSGSPGFSSPEATELHMLPPDGSPPVAESPSSFTLWMK